MTDFRGAPGLSVVIPCLGHAAELGACLAALSTQDGDPSYEIVVVDSANDDRVAEVASAFPGVKLVRSDANLSAGPARNLGVSRAAGEVLVFTDADCIPERGFLRAARAALDHGAKLVTGPVGNAPGGFVASCDNLLQFADFSAGRKSGPATYAPGCNLAMRKADFLAAGAFPRTRAEDTLLSAAVAATWPKKAIFDSNMRVRHHGRATLAQMLAHHRAFGADRAVHDQSLRLWQRRLGRYGVMLLPVVVKRLSYIASRTLRYSPRRALFLICAAPVLILGLVAWARGFREGLRVNDRET